MSQKLPNMLEGTIQKIREMVDVNSVIGDTITTPDGVTIIPVSKVSVVEATLLPRPEVTIPLAAVLAAVSR